LADVECVVINGGWHEVNGVGLSCVESVCRHIPCYFEFEMSCYLKHIPLFKMDFQGKKFARQYILLYVKCTAVLARHYGPSWPVLGRSFYLLFEEDAVLGTFEKWKITFQSQDTL
jgi:hypothetical protein